MKKPVDNILKVGAITNLYYRVGAYFAVSADLC